MQVILNIDSAAIIDAAEKMPLEEKLKLYEKIKDDILQYRFEILRKELKDTVSLSDEEITQEVENVRSERYKNRG
ncbi:MAG TPA: hypothetical protein PK859_08785 [Spirochaetota bacterium]|nr:hypothetical protein [Spirochaetota bacterium]HPR49674.1 hypothetical protein [Spirochaetota bacterium]